MVEPGDDFDDLHDEGRQGPLLPPEDRLWRHPSELGEHGQPVSEEALSARRSWMASTPSRAGAWSAGIVGAVLATGVVLVGVHLTHLMYSPPSRPSAVSTAKHDLLGSHFEAPTTSIMASLFTTTTTMATSGNLGLGRLVTRVASAMPIVFDGNQSGVGVVVNSKGYVLVPATLVSDPSDVSVVIDGQQLVASVVGVDSGTGLAVVRVHDIDALAADRFVPDSAIGTGSFVALVWVAPDGLHTCWGTVDDLDVRLTASDSSPPLLESLRALDSMPGTATGGVVIDGAGRLIGMVTDVTGKALVATPGWLVDVVSKDLVADGRVVHGWLGITGETVSTSAAGSAVEVLSVQPGGAAAKAGMKPGDIIEGVNGERIKSMSAMVAALYVLPPDRSIVLNVVRGSHLWAARAHLMPAA